MPAPKKKTAKPATKPIKTQPVHRHEEKREVRVALQDPAERERILQDMLANMKTEHELELEAKETAVGYRKRIKELTKNIEGQSLDLKQGLPTMRPCIITRSFKGSEKFPNGSLTIEDKETGVVYEKRALTDEDAQLPISDMPNAQEEVGAEDNPLGDAPPLDDLGDDDRQ